MLEKLNIFKENILKNTITRPVPTIPNSPPGMAPEGRKEKEVDLESEESEDTPLKDQQQKPVWRKEDYVAIVIYLMVNLAEAVESYLPGVINQVVSLELGVPWYQEGLLGYILWISFAGSMIGVALWSSRFKRRPLLLCGLYISILATGFCAVVPNYYTLLLSRVLIGLCLGVTAATVGVYFSDAVSSREVFLFGTFLTMLFYNVGSGWTALLAYLTLESVGWRWFILLTAIPFYILPIALLHCFPDLGEQQSEEDKEESQCLMGEEEERGSVHKKEVPWSRILKSSLLDFTNELQGYGTILLLPALIRYYNEHSNDTGDPYESVVRGSQFLILALVFGVVELFGKTLGYALNSRIGFRVLQPILAVVVTLCYTAILFSESLVLTIVVVSVANTAFAMMQLEIVQMRFDRDYFGPEHLVLASGIMGTVGVMGAVAGMMLAALLQPYTAVAGTLACTVIQIAVVVSITDYNNNLKTVHKDS